jgi:hypothetical protein
MVQIDLPIANGRYPMQIFAATRCSRYPMPDAALKQTKQTKLCFKNGHCFNRRSNCQKLKKMVQKMVLSWSKLTFDYTKLKLQEQGSLLNGPIPLKMVQNGPKLNTK